VGLERPVLYGACQSGVVEEPKNSVGVDPTERSDGSKVVRNSVGELIQGGMNSCFTVRGTGNQGTPGTTKRVLRLTLERPGERYSVVNKTAEG